MFASHPVWSGRSLRVLLVASLIALFIGLPLVSRAFHGHPNAHVLTETEESTKGKSDSLELKLDFSGLVAGIEHGPIDLVPAYAERVADDLAEWESAFADAHLQRGPPSC